MVKSKMLAAWAPSRDREGESIPCSSPSSRGLWAVLGIPWLVGTSLPCVLQPPRVWRAPCACLCPNFSLLMQTPVLQDQGPTLLTSLNLQLPLCLVSKTEFRASIRESGRL